MQMLVLLMLSQRSLKLSLKKTTTLWTNMAIQWLRLHVAPAGGACSIPGWGTRILHATWCSQRKKKSLLFSVQLGWLEDTSLSFSSLICSSVSSNLLLIPSGVFFSFSYCILCSVWLSLIFSNSFRSFYLLTVFVQFLPKFSENLCDHYCDFELFIG